MPIKTENKALYPADWPEIRERILTRAGQRRGADGRVDVEAKCEGCGVRNHGLHPVTHSWVVLTIAHRDHDPRNCAPDNLRAWCQRCHNRYDREHRNATARATRRGYAEKAGQGELAI